MMASTTIPKEEFRMKWDVTPYRDTVMDYAKVLLGQDSPSGFTAGALGHCRRPASGHPHRRAADANVGRGILPHLYP